MWADQGNHYDDFVAFVKETAPDICIWCEAKTHYHTHSGEVFAAESDSLYLPAHWSELAARYGHQYVFTGGERDFFPQVITSRYPLQELNEFIPTGGKRRIDYIYCTPPVLHAIRRLEVMQEGYPARKKTDIRNFWIPSDHLPILVELIFPH